MARIVKLSLCGQLLRVSLIAFNVILGVLGMALVIVGSIMVATGNLLEFLTGSVIVGGATLIILAGLVTFIISASGLVGAILLSKTLLGFYLIAVTLVMMLELITGILGLVHKDKIEGTVTQLAHRAIEDYRLNKTDTINAVDLIQAQFSCCGWNSSLDWGNSSVPASCQCTTADLFCDKDTLLWADGCKDGVVEFAKEGVFILALVGLLFGAVQGLSLLMMGGLCVSIKKSTETYYRVT
ncbi:tetraspanin-33-like [Halichondria panicea]|uniref:tetraspanin-33-like n=1 Tax=Halichondria panicea TaxID=6063 RepID=UPI00312B8243